jgi:hypothetical protein
MKTFLAIAAVSAGLSAGPAYADAYPPWVFVVRDCADDGKLDHTYRHVDLTQALQQLPSDGDEYSDCANAIRRALTGGSGSTMTPPPNAVVAASGAIAASNEDIAQLETVVAAADAGQIRAVQIPAQIPARSRVIHADAALAGLAARSGVPYRPDFALIAGILSAGLLAISVAATRARRRAAG